MTYKDIQKQKKYQQDHYQRNKQLVYSRSEQRRIEAKESAMKSLYAKNIIDMRLFKLWFNDKKKDRAPYDISPTDAFNLMIQRCFYCGEFAITLDRLNSKLNHTLDNCVGCCVFCNVSKQATDPLTFILRAVYRRTFAYYEDNDIWYDNKTKPRWDMYKARAKRQNRSFELTKEQFNKLIVGQCHYCKRHSSTSKFFGIDKIYPDDGYTLDNCVTACANCNLSKLDANPDEFTLRDERITQRYLAGYFDDLSSIPKNTSNQKYV